MKPQGCSGLILLVILSVTLLACGCNTILDGLHKIPAVNKVIPPQESKAQDAEKAPKEWANEEVDDASSGKIAVLDKAGL